MLARCSAISAARALRALGGERFAEKDPIDAVDEPRHRLRSRLLLRRKPSLP
jgi:hypothetical protein